MYNRVILGKGTCHLRSNEQDQELMSLATHLKSQTLPEWGIDREEVVVVVMVVCVHVVCVCGVCVSVHSIYGQSYCFIPQRGKFLPHSSEISV